MHELSITQNILDIILKEAEKNAAKKITKVNLKIGDFTFIEPECVSHYFELLAKDTPASGALLEIERVPLKFRCKTCSLEFTIDKDSPP
ncbi:MAG: hydrogenase maturation nickel metallochaperone HypA, partial [Firmicutes bacterium]|nr:hydrogenase maturation nickel metallochaperone HypA [Bacillota bacterium]